ncbi:MAG: hypothetical protein Q7T10_18980 [Rhodoferax sp.]|nr:hypothetical protein [Rhodoferax sp.]
MISIARRAVEQKKDQLPNMTYPVECYFERGIRFRADDHIVRMLYAQFLIDKARTADAGKQLELVAKMVSDNGFATYNIGLLYSDMKDYGQALAYAHKAMALGFDRPQLRQRLESVGRWTEPTAESGGLPASAASAPAPISAASAPATQTD